MSKKRIVKKIIKIKNRYQKASRECIHCPVDLPVDKRCSAPNPASVPQPDPLLEEKEMGHLFKTFATTAWRMRNVIIDVAGTKESRDFLDGRAVSRLARYLESLEGALEDARIQTKGDYEGCPYDEGDAVKVVAFEERHDLSRDEYIETLLPTIRWLGKDGNSKLLQQAEVVVGKASFDKRSK